MRDKGGMDPEFWRGRRVLLTGHTGFKGAWLTLWLHRLGARVAALSLPPLTQPNLYDLTRIETFCTGILNDIRDPSSLADLVRETNPEIVFHLAAQALVRPSYRDPIETFGTNVMGTAHLLDALRGRKDLRVAVLITPDKVYRNHEWHWPYREEDALGGRDPYSASKAASELIIASYRESFLKSQGVAVASARAGNVIGGGDWSEDRLLPDAIRAWREGQVLPIRRPDAIRPWQHVLEPLAGYLSLAEFLWNHPHQAGPYNFGPDPQDAATVRQVIELARAAYGDVRVQYAEAAEGPHEAGCLTLEIAKARNLLGFRPRWPLEETVRRTVAWYRAQLEGNDARGLCEADIVAYEARA